MSDYERWKKGEKISKFSWVIDYYKSITDVNQYKKGQKVERVVAVVCGAFGFFVGVLICYLILM